MATKTRKAKNSTPKFENQTRFNWGYHDASQAVQEGWDTEANNYGFAHHGPLGTLNPENLLAKHFDSTYAHGWLAGYRDSKNGTYTGNSQAAWDKAKNEGKVSE